MKKRLGKLLPLFLLLPASLLSAQPGQGRLGIGTQIGLPSGLALKYYSPTGLPIDDFFATKAIDALVTWDFEEVVLFDIHVVNERPLPNSPLRYFIGPGIVIALEDKRGDIGISGNLGINFYSKQFEIFLQITPRLMLLRRVNGELGSGVGLRYFF